MTHYLALLSNELARLNLILISSSCHSRNSCITQLLLRESFSWL